MGWFSWGRTLSNPSKKIIGGTHQQLHNLLYQKLPHLHQNERERVYQEIIKKLDNDGKVTGYEWEERLNPIFYKMWKEEGLLSEYDYETLKKLGHELEG